MVVGVKDVVRVSLVEYTCLAPPLCLMPENISKPNPSCLSSSAFRIQHQAYPIHKNVPWIPYPSQQPQLLDTTSNPQCFIHPWPIFNLQPNLPLIPPSATAHQHYDAHGKAKHPDNSNSFLMRFLCDFC